MRLSSQSKGAGALLAFHGSLLLYHVSATAILLGSCAILSLLAAASNILGLPCFRCCILQLSVPEKVQES
jgi:hypothetical protein